MLNKLMLTFNNIGDRVISLALKTFAGVWVLLIMGFMFYLIFSGFLWVITKLWGLILN